MKAIKVLLVVLLGLIFNFCSVQCYHCNVLNEDNGTISVYQDVYGSYPGYRKCWAFYVADGYVLQLRIAQFEIISQDICGGTTSDYWRRATSTDSPYDWWRKTSTNSPYDRWRETSTNSPYDWRRATSTNSPYPTSSNYYRRTSGTTSSYYWRTTPNYPYGNIRASLMIQDKYEDVKYTFNPLNFKRNTLTIRSNANITLEVDGQGLYNRCKSNKISLKLEFLKVSGIEALEGLNEVREKVVTWMKKQLLPPLKWHDDIQKMVIALHLSGEMDFTKTGVNEEMLIKQVDLKSTVSLLRNKTDKVSLSKLAKIIHSLLVTCHNPRKFYGYDLIKMVEEKLEDPSVLARSPLAYIALCNANVTLNYKSVQQLLNTMRQHEIHSQYIFSSDISALAFMALTCIRNRDNEVREITEQYYNETLEFLRMQQQEDGSFGNIYSTAIITQALMSSNLQNHTILNATVFPAIEYLIHNLNTSDFGLMAAYYSLPILSGKTILDIRHTDCSRNPRRDRDGSDISDAIDDSEKIKVQYSLIMGDKEDVTNTLTLRVPDNTTAYDLMQIAQSIESRYKFEWKRVSGKMYVYEIAGIPVDPEEGNFWLMYYKTNLSRKLNRVLGGPEKLLLHNGYHLIQWYKTVHL